MLKSELLHLIWPKRYHRELGGKRFRRRKTLNGSEESLEMCVFVNFGSVSRLSHPERFGSRIRHKLSNLAAMAHWRVLLAELLKDFLSRHPHSGWKSAIMVAQLARHLVPEQHKGALCYLDGRRLPSGIWKGEESWTQSVHECWASRSSEPSMTNVPLNLIATTHLMVRK